MLQDLLQKVEQSLPSATAQSPSEWLDKASTLSPPFPLPPRGERNSKPLWSAGDHGARGTFHFYFSGFQLIVAH